MNDDGISNLDLSDFTKRLVRLQIGESVYDPDNLPVIT